MRGMECKGIEELVDDGRTLAIIVRSTFEQNGIRFFTPDAFSQQLAYMNRPAGYVIEPHVHNPVPRAVSYTQEVLLIKRGRLRVDLYTPAQVYVKSRILEAGDLILLATGGHGFEVLEEIEMIEVKQGPFVGNHDKTRFAGISREQAREE